jgi:hypothetical protein
MKYRRRPAQSHLDLQNVGLVPGGFLTTKTHLLHLVVPGEVELWVLFTPLCEQVRTTAEVTDSTD